MFTRSTLAVTVLCAVTLAGCASSPEAQPAKTTAASGKSDKPQRIQSAIADCMKQKGFRYVAWVPKPKPETDNDKAANGDYEAMKRVRSKQGFNVFYQVADPGSFRKQAAYTRDDDPNSSIRDSLSKAQLRSYDKVLDSCNVKALKDVTGKVVKSMDDEYEQYEKAYKAAFERELNGDPKLLELAATMGDCVKGKGYRVDSVSPTSMADRGYREFSAQMNAIAKKQGLVDEDAGENTVYQPRLSPATANQYLAKEIKAALDDLECGKDFYADFYPKSGRIGDRLDSEFGRWQL
ncbi:hypothetical protein [Nonomuraea aurantiaca]|uniref:hypothetical protein n=1 Tax=Nonomuraea aurantiaca TaxID=2878562 RepID=UPI001CD9D9C5|nr:hypothetical protein [Nonomuraea aurantiaca]MCA2220501.1 hypothetical protein [Nonomuraea aurantiaca]